MTIVADRGVCVVFVLPGKRQKPQGSLQTAPVSPVCEGAFLQSAFSNVAAQQHECLCKKESDQYLLPALGRNSLQLNEVGAPTVAFQLLTVVLWGINTRDGAHRVTMPLDRGGGGADWLL